MAISVPVSHFATPAVQDAFRSGRIAQLRVRPKIAFHLLRMLRKVDEEIVNYEKARVAAFKQYGEEYEQDGQPMARVLPANLPAFQEAMTELGNTQIEFALDKITLSDLGDAELSAQEMLALEPFLDAA